jgi:hypothetical protein
MLNALVSLQSAWYSLSRRKKAAILIGMGICAYVLDACDLPNGD